MKRKEESDEREMVHIRISRSLVTAIDHLAVDNRKYRNEMIEQLLFEALEKQTGWGARQLA